MKKRVCTWAAHSLLLFVGCTGGTSVPDPTPSDTERDAYCAVAARPDLSVWIGDFVTLCQAPNEEELPACSAGRVTEGGMAELPWALELGAIRVLPAADGRFVALLRDERLVLTRSDGGIERELASWANDPWISDDGERVVWVGLADGFDAWDFGVPTVIVMQRLDQNASTVIVNDELASTPRPIPGSSDVLYVSVRTGVASFWIAGPEREPRQLTNIGLDEVGPQFVPVADRQIAWTPGALFYGVAEEDGSWRVWRLPLTDGAAVEVGPGMWPRVRTDGSLFAFQPSSGSACAANYPAGGTP